jgi:hypothetical protein
MATEVLEVEIMRPCDLPAVRHPLCIPKLCSLALLENFMPSILQLGSRSAMNARQMPPARVKPEMELDQSRWELEEEWELGRGICEDLKGGCIHKREGNVEVQGFVIWRKEINHSNAAKRWVLRKGGAGKVPDIDFERLHGGDLPAKVAQETSNELEKTNLCHGDKVLNMHLNRICHINISKGSVSIFLHQFTSIARSGLQRPRTDRRG